MSTLGVEYGCPYVLTGPDGTRVVFNDDADEDFIGILSPESSGLDAPDVREDATDATEEDGGHHGNFFEGRRPVVLQGTIIATSAKQRNERVAKLKRASRALRGDATLEWEPSGGAKVELKLRRQQPLRVTKGYVKDFQVGMVAADIFPKGTTVHTETIEINSQTKAPGAAKLNGADGGNRGWDFQENIFLSDNKYAASYVLEAVGGGSEYFFAYKYNFSVPAGAIIAAVYGSIERQQYAEGEYGEGNHRVEDKHVYMVKNGTLVGTNKAVAGTWPIGTDATNKYSFDPTLVSATDINAEKFGFQLSVKTPDPGAYARVDYMPMTVEYYAPVELKNEGDAPAYPTIKIYGPGSAFKLENATTEEFILLEGVELKAGEYFEINFKNHTIKKNGTAYAYNALVFASSNWWALEPGANNIVVTGETAEVEWQDTYI